MIQTNYVTIFYRLFVLPHYCSAMVDLALLHSRKKKFKSKPNSDSNSNSNSNPKSDTKTKQKTEPKIVEKIKTEDPEYMVFICATMWHESRKEMEKILRSIKRYSHKNTHTHNTETHYQTFHLKCAKPCSSFATQYLITFLCTCNTRV